MATAAKKKGGSANSDKVHFIPILETRDFPGTYSYPKAQQIPRGAAQESLDFLTRETWVELRGGYHPLGTEVAGSGKCLGIFTAHTWSGTEVIFKATLDGKLTWYDPNDTSGNAVNGWSEVGGVGANILAKAAAAGENVYMDEYFSPAGAQLWVSSPSSDLIKIMTANPVSWLSQYNSSVNFKGRIRIMNNSMFLWHYNTTGAGKGTNAVLQRSYIDSQNYATVSSESETLALVGTTGVSGTLASVSGVKTCFAISIVYTDTLNTYTETFTDDNNGNLIGTNGGTGTVNYTTGAFVLTPNQAPSSLGDVAASATYQTEDSTDGGIADFIPDIEDNVRTPGSGVSWTQSSGGDILDVQYYDNSYYVMHQRNSWVVTPSSDDSTATNLIYRQNMWLPSEQGSVSTADGIYYVDVTTAARPFIALIALDANNVALEVLPDDISSELLDLSGLVFDQCRAIQALDWILFFCRTPGSAQNNRVIAYNTKLSTEKKRVFDTLSYFGNCATIYGGQIVAGDSLSNNAYKLFDGFDDDGGLQAYATWVGNDDDHGIAGLKQCKKLWIEGYIGTNQVIPVYVTLDAGNPVLVGNISGKAAYVDQGLSVTIGSLQIGSYPIGGPQSEIVGYHYIAEIRINTAKYKYFTISFGPPQGIGYFSFQMYANYDIRINVDKLPSKYRQTPASQPLSLGSNPYDGAGALTPYGSVYTETPQGLVNGVNTVYTVSHKLLAIYGFQINGEQINSTMYTYTYGSNQITFKVPLPAQLSGTPFEIVYLGG